MLQIQADGPVVRLTLDRPEVRNAFNDELISVLTKTIEGISHGTRAVVLRGNGASFCAGGDLEWMRKAAGYSEEDNVRDAIQLAKLFKSITDCPAVVIALVHGAAFGGGAGLVSACDVAIAADDAKFAFSEVKLGLIPSTISPFVIDKIGRGHARALFSTGEPFDAQTALRIGLVHEVTPFSGLDEAAARKLVNVLASGPGAVTGSKRLVLDQDLSLEECARRLARTRASAEGREGVAAFLEKRKASFVVEYAKEPASRS